MEGEAAYFSGKARLRDLSSKPGVSRVSEGAWLQLLKNPLRAYNGLVPVCLSILVGEADHPRASTIVLRVYAGFLGMERCSDCLESLSSCSKIQEKQDFSL